MERITLITIIIIISIIICCNKSKKFENFEIQADNVDKTTESPYKPDICLEPSKQIDCCLLSKKYNVDNGQFTYTYTKLENENCDLKLFRLDSNKQLFFEGENNWSNEKCSNKNKIIGSCRNINKECIDFVDKEFCDKYKMVWSNKTCHDPLDYNWIDTNKISSPQADINDTFRMF